MFAALQQAQKDGDADKVNKYSELLYDQALLIEGLPLEDPVAYAQPGVRTDEISGRFNKANRTVTCPFQRVGSGPVFVGGICETLVKPPAKNKVLPKVKLGFAFCRIFC